MSPSTVRIAKPFPLGHQPSCASWRGELSKTVTLRPGRGQDRPLLPAAGGQAEHVGAGQRREPGARHRDRRREQDAPLAPPRGGHDLAGLTGIVHGLPSATCRFQASRL